MTDDGHRTGAPGEPREVQDSHHDASGDMGVSSEREGQAGPGQHGTDGVRDVTPSATDGDDVPPDQRPGGEEPNSEHGQPPRSGYNSRDPRSD